jgi:1-acyl-sn-glycerol-3-phosphate acyltransferase
LAAKKGKWLRRTVTFPAYAILFVLVWSALPLVLAVSLLTDVVRGRGLVSVRILAFFAWYLFCEVAGVLAAFVLWAAHRIVPGRTHEEFLDWNFRLQCLWARALGECSFKIFGNDVSHEGDEAFGERPVLLFVRHSSVADTILAAILVAHARGIRLRYVLKRELLWDPCLDVVGNRLPNYFVRRDAVDTAAEVDEISRLADGLVPGEGVIIYPEGTRFSRRLRERTIEKFVERGDELRASRARSLEHTLLPRPAGAMALLDKREGKDVVFCAHTGLEAARSFHEIWRGELIGRSVKVRFWKVPAHEIPEDREAREAWFFEQWRLVDAFVAQHSSSPPPAECP